MTLDILEHGLSLLCPLFWEAVGHLKTKFKLNVIASTSDKASRNQRLKLKVKRHNHEAECSDPNKILTSF